MTAEGNFEGHTILNRLARVPASEEDEPRLASLRTMLLVVRGKRVRPGLDDKVLADWNGLMIAALVNAGVAFGEPAWLDMAARAFAFIADDMTRGDRLGHSWRDGRLLFPGLSSDFAAMIKAALALYEATGERSYLLRASSWQRALDRHYAAGNGGYFLTADDAEGLVLRPDATTDDATPNPNGSPRRTSCGSPCSRATMTGARAPTGCSTASFRSRPATCSATRRCSMRSTCGCAPPRSW